METVFPKVLLLGNGINRSFSGDSWNELLRRMNSNARISDNQVGKLRSPMPLKAILLTNDHIDRTMRDIHQDLYGKINNGEQKALLRKLLSLDFDYILTTNYSYELEEACNK